MGLGGVLFAAAGAQAVTQIASGYAQNAEAKQNASAVIDTGNYNAAMLNMKAGQIDIQSNIEQGQYTRMAGEYASKSISAIAKQGVGVDGSPMAVMIGAQTQIGIDAAIAKYNSTTQKNYTIAEANDATRTAGLQADAMKRQGSLAVRGGYTGALSSLMQGATTYAMYKYKLP